MNKIRYLNAANYLEKGGYPIDWNIVQERLRIGELLK